jgi:hypothetical protein
MPANVNIVAAVSLQAVDATAAVTVVNRIVNGIQLAGTGYFYNDWMQVTVGGVGVGLPNIPVWSVYIRNLGSNNINLTFQPVGGSTTSPIVILPNGFFWYHQTAESAGGISAITLTAIGSTTPAEVFVGF